MKAKSIILSGLLLLGAGAATTSCEDMFTPENKLVTTDLAPKDTVYQLMGIVKNMQVIAERTVLLGEARADLVSFNSHTPTALYQLATGEANANENTSVANAYNQPKDYYNVINSCNIYLANVDSTLRTHGEYYYEPEIIAAKAYRAWTYLELAKIYGQVPFTTEPVLTPQAAEQLATATADRADLAQICDFCIADLEPYAALSRNHELLPFDYNSWKFKDQQGRFFFLPVRLMLAELYLWRGVYTHSDADFVEAVRYYHDFLTFTNEEVTTGSNRAYWRGINFSNSTPTSSYTNEFRYGESYQFVIPMDTISFYGNTQDLRATFCAVPKNSNYALLNPSRRLLEISQAQVNSIYVYNTPTDNYVQYAPHDAGQFNAVSRGGSSFVNTSPEYYVGDLRLSQVYVNRSASPSTLMYHSDYSPEEQTIYKYTNGVVNISDDERQDYVGFYRAPIIYLHFAEALNYAGLPETAFAVLKYGLSQSVLQDTTIVSTYEYEKLQSIASRGFSGMYATAAGWNPNVFRTRDQQSGGYNSVGVGNLGEIQPNQYGIHALGSGDSFFADLYYLPTDSSGIVDIPEITIVLDDNSTAADSLAYDAEVQAQLDARQANLDWLQSDQVRQQRIQAVACLILDEEALEGMFEGTRYYDLMRYALYFGDDNFIADQVSLRGGADTPDAAVRANFAGRQNWYLRLPKR